MYQKKKLKLSEQRSSGRRSISEDCFSGNLPEERCSGTCPETQSSESFPEESSSRNSLLRGHNCPFTVCWVPQQFCWVHVATP